MPPSSPGPWAYDPGGRHGQYDSGQAETSIWHLQSTYFTDR